jgi:hypothetical protein
MFLADVIGFTGIARAAEWAKLAALTEAELDAEGREG